MRTPQVERGIMVNRIRVEILPNPDYRKFHVNTVVSSQKIYGGILGGSRHDPFSQTRSKEIEFSEDTKATVMRFYDIDGISCVGLDTYEVDIFRSPAYEWDEIHEQIIDIITEIVCWSDVEFTVDYLFVGRVYEDPVTREAYEAEMERQRAEERRAEQMFGF